MIGIAIIGCGRIAGHHCRSIKRNKKFKLISVCDLNIDRANYYSKLYNVPAYTNYHDMISSNLSKIDIVAIMTPSGLHYYQAKNIIKSYKKSLIVEKPAFFKTKQVESIYDLAKSNNVKIYPIFQNRFNKAVQFVKSYLCQKNKVNINLVTVRVRWNRPQRYYDMDYWRGTYSLDGGCLANQGIHHLDLLRYLFGEVKLVNFKMGSFGAKIEAPDTAIGLIEFDSGVYGNIEITTAARPNDIEASISILTSAGYIEIGGIAVNELKYFTKNPKLLNRHSEDFSKDVYGKGHYKLYKSIGENFLENKKYLIDKKDLFQTIQLLNACHYSNSINKTVIVNKTKDFSLMGKYNKEIFNKYNPL